MRNTSVDKNVSCQHFPIEPRPLMVWLLSIKNVTGMTAEWNLRFYLHWANLNSHVGSVAGMCDSISMQGTCCVLSHLAVSDCVQPHRL